MAKIELIEWFWSFCQLFLLEDNEPVRIFFTQVYNWIATWIQSIYLSRYLHEKKINENLMLVLKKAYSQFNKEKMLCIDAIHSEWLYMQGKERELTLIVTHQRQNAWK